MTLKCWDVTSTLLQDVSMDNNMAVVLLQNCRRYEQQYFRSL